MTRANAQTLRLLGQVARKHLRDRSLPGSNPFSATFQYVVSGSIREVASTNPCLNDHQIIRLPTTAQQPVATFAASPAFSRLFSTLSRGVNSEGTGSPSSPTAPTEPSSSGGSAHGAPAGSASEEFEERGEALASDLSPPASSASELPEDLSDEFFERMQLSDEELHSAILMRDVSNVEGLPPLAELLEPPEDAGKRQRRERELSRQEAARRQRAAQVDALGRAYATGRRKTSAARVWLQPGSGEFRVNGRPVDCYFPDLSQRMTLLLPFAVTDTVGRFDVAATVRGGGVAGQAGAVIHGISRALQNYRPEWRPPLKKNGLLTRDPRMVERKKPGKAKARKSFQWVKR